MSKTFGHSFLAGTMMGSERKLPTKENCPLQMEILSFDRDRTTEPTIFPFQPRILRTLASPGPESSVIRDFTLGIEKVSPVANPRPFE